MEGLWSGIGMGKGGNWEGQGGDGEGARRGIGRGQGGEQGVAWEGPRLPNLQEREALLQEVHCSRVPQVSPHPPPLPWLAFLRIWLLGAGSVVWFLG